MFPPILFILLLTSTPCSKIQQRNSLRITLYYNEFALVKDIRTIEFEEGQSSLYFTDVAEKMMPETVSFKVLGDAGAVRVGEQNFQRNVVDRGKILEKYLQREIDIVSQFGDQFNRVHGLLLSHTPTLILQTPTSTLSPTNTPIIQLPQLPADLFTRPTLSWRVTSTEAQTLPCEVAYRTGGFRLQVDYTLVLGLGQGEGDQLGAWVTIVNESGKMYEDVMVKFVAGQVRTVKPKANPPTLGRSPTPSPPPPQFTQKQFSDYHLYTLSQPITLHNNQQKQIQLTPKIYNLSLQKYYLITVPDGGGDSVSTLPVRAMVTVRNSREAGLGGALPKGVVTVFGRDQEGVEYIGEDSIEHTPKNQNITLNLGTTSNILCTLTRSRLPSSSTLRQATNSSVHLTNQTPNPAHIRIRLTFRTNFIASNLQIIEWENNRGRFVRISFSQYQMELGVGGGQRVEVGWVQGYGSGSGSGSG